MHYLSADQILQASIPESMHLVYSIDMLWNIVDKLDQLQDDYCVRQITVMKSKPKALYWA